MWNFQGIVLSNRKRHMMGIGIKLFSLSKFSMEQHCYLIPSTIGHFQEVLHASICTSQNCTEVALKINFYFVQVMLMYRYIFKINQPSLLKH